GPAVWAPAWSRGSENRMCGVGTVQPRCSNSARVSAQLSPRSHVPWMRTTCLMSAMASSVPLGGAEGAFEPLHIGVDVTDRRFSGVHADRDGVADAVHTMRQAHHR